ncbi:flagellar assembly peptidoglycan hydrolase FlgJ [Enterobacter pasteurii]|uniref:flagellar assembly peptidoglycan hydrolase FlgJ n=1 Tax=Enterobacter pasteurii TaxID=3029761 RepID=UPI0011DD9D19|nr:flagellar assembly peptidoglycan hydrolase FlgJ [Enterobacter pasteurii]QLA68109.1 flagellar assembly peptidoglycan hydrolase FlgJ [Enterobacter pasteurii]
MNSLPLSSGAAFDLHSLDKLKTEVKSNSSTGLRAAARQMEGLFVQMMLKSMRDASFKGGLFDSEQSKMFTSLYDQQLAQNIAENGKLGFADLMIQQMTGEKPVHSSEQHTQPVPLTISPEVFKSTPSERAPSAISSLMEDVAARYSTATGDNSGFIARLLAPAVAVARKSGIPHQLILAQAALESGWGKEEIRTRNGRPSHNLFGIKATNDWQGETTEVTTTEYVKGIPHKMKQPFKVYDSYTDALMDYASLLINNPRYRNVLHSVSPEMAAKALLNAGYATDPDYAKKLINIIRQIKGSVSQKIGAYAHDLTSIF